MMKIACSVALAIGLALGIPTSGVAAAEADFDGSPVSIISGLSLGCKAPYVLTRDCSGWSGATRKIPALSPEFRVAGSADGTVVFVVSTRLLPTAGRTEHTAAMVVRDVAASVGAKVVKAEAVSAGPRIMGYVLSFDRDVYETLTTHPGVPTPVAKIPPGVQLEGDSPLVSCRLVDSLPLASGPAAEVAASAAVAPLSTDIAAPAQAPAGRRYAMVVRDSGQVSLMRVGTTMLTNAAIRMEVANQVLDCVRIAVQSVLNPSRGFELVPTEQVLSFVLPPFHVNQFDGMTSAGSTAQTREQAQALLPELARLAEASRLSFIVVINDWGSHDGIEHSNQPIEGYGIYQGSFLGLRDIYAFAAIQVSVYDPKSGKLVSRSELGHKKLEKQRWFELRKDERPALETVRSFLPDIEAALPLKRLPTLLCELQLLPVRVRAERFSLQSDCSLSYGMP